MSLKYDNLSRFSLFIRYQRASHVSDEFIHNVTINSLLRVPVDSDFRFTATSFEIFLDKLLIVSS